MSNHETAIREGAAAKVGGEQILAAIVASPRGSTTAQLGGAAGMIGMGMSGKQQKGAQGAGLVVQRNSGLVLTPTRLLSFALKISFVGAVKEVGEQLGELPVDQIDSIEAKRMGAAGVITVNANGSDFKLETKAGPAKDLAEAFQQVRPGG
jgi:hypothetical protein